MDQRMPAATNLDELLAERGKTHGDYSMHAWITQSIKAIHHQSPNWDRLTPIQKETLDMVAHKIGRVLAGDPDVADHWDDMAGYAKLTADRLPPK